MGHVFEHKSKETVERLKLVFSNQNRKIYLMPDSLKVGTEKYLVGTGKGKI